MCLQPTSLKIACLNGCLLQRTCTAPFLFFQRCHPYSTITRRHAFYTLLLILVLVINETKFCSRRLGSRCVRVVSSNCSGIFRLYYVPSGRTPPLQRPRVVCVIFASSSNVFSDIFVKLDLRANPPDCFSNFFLIFLEISGTYFNCSYMLIAAGLHYYIPIPV